MGLCKKNVTPFLTHWSYVFLALSHCYHVWDNDSSLVEIFQRKCNEPWIWQNNHKLDLIHKSQNAPVPYPTMQHSEQKCAHFCSECCIVGYGTGAFWDLWDWSIEMSAWKAIQIVPVLGPGPYPTHIFAKICCKKIYFITSHITSQASQLDKHCSFRVPSTLLNKRIN